MRARLWRVSTIVVIGALGCAGCTSSPSPAAKDPGPTQAVTSAESTAEPLSVAEALVAAAQVPIVGSLLPDDLHYVEDLTQPGISGVLQIYGTDAYPEGPVVAVGARSLADYEQASASRPPVDSEPLPSVAPGAELVRSDGGPSVLIDDGTTLVQFIATRYDEAHLVAFVESVAASVVP